MPDNEDATENGDTAAENGDLATETDIFQQQKRTIDTLIDVLERQPAIQPAQPVFITQTEGVKKPTNYVLYIGLALAAFIFLRK